MRIAVAGSSGLIGSHLCALAEAAGHQVARLSRTDGVDLLDRDAVATALAGADAVVDVSRPSAMDLDPARDFFVTVARNLADAGVPRNVVLSIVGIDEGQDYDWYAATLAHEQATREFARGARVLRSTQFHEFPGQVLQRALADRTSSGVVEIMDVPTQPVASDEVAKALLELAVSDEDADGDADRQIAGPWTERLVNLVADLAVHDGLDLEVRPGSAPASMAGGSMLPGPEVPTVGPDWHTWLRQR